MADYVVDTSVVIEYLITETHTPNARAFFKQIAKSDRLIVPEFCLLECVNVIWKRVTFNSMSLTDAKILLGILRRLKFHRAPMKQLLDHALEIGLNNKLAIYDSCYIALAHHYNCPLVSIDQRQLQAATAEGIVALPITNFIPLFVEGTE